MSELDPLPRAARPFLGFVHLLRGERLCGGAGTERTAFLSAISLLGPRDPEDIRRAGLANARAAAGAHGAYNALFRIHFLGETAPVLGDAEDDDIVRVQEEQRGEGELPRSDESQ